MKFTILCLFFCLVTIPMSSIAFGYASYGINGLAANQQANKQQANKQQGNKQQLRINSGQQAAQQAKGRYGGKVLKVQKQKPGYRVKLIKKDGHIVSVAVDEKTGSS